MLGLSFGLGLVISYYTLVGVALLLVLAAGARVTTTHSDYARLTGGRFIIMPVVSLVHPEDNLERALKSIEKHGDEEMVAHRLAARLPNTAKQIREGTVQPAELAKELCALIVARSVAKSNNRGQRNLQWGDR